MESIYYRLLWYPALLGRMGGQSGGCNHTLQWRVQKCREISDFPRTHNGECNPPQIPLPLAFCGWQLDALEKTTQPKKELKPSFHHLSLYFHFWSKIQVSSEAKLLRRTIAFQLCPSSTDPSHGQPCHNSLFNVILLSDQWSVWHPRWLRAQNFLNQKPHDGSTKNYLRFHWPSLDEELMWVNWEGGHLCWALVS